MKHEVEADGNITENLIQSHLGQNKNRMWDYFWRALNWEIQYDQQFTPLTLRIITYSEFDASDMFTNEICLYKFLMVIHPIIGETYARPKRWHWRKS